MTARITKAMLEEQNTTLAGQNQELLQQARYERSLEALASKAQAQMTGEGSVYKEFADALVEAFKEVVEKHCCCDVQDALDRGTFYNLSYSIVESLNGEY